VRKRFERFVSLGAWVLASALMACTLPTESSSGKTGCVQSSDCLAGHVCVSGRCEIPADGGLAPAEDGGAVDGGSGAADGGASLPDGGGLPDADGGPQPPAMPAWHCVDDGGTLLPDGGFPASYLAVSGLRGATDTDTLEPFSPVFGNPQDSTVETSREQDIVHLTGQNARWTIGLELQLSPQTTAPVSLTFSSYPSKVSFVWVEYTPNGPGYTNDASNQFLVDEDFVVDLSRLDGSRIAGTFHGYASTLSLDASRNFGYVDVCAGSFDLGVPSGP
jgi:hypothetical protein